MISQPANTHLAQLNVATAVDDIDSDRLADFVGALDHIDALAERSPGFVWRTQDEAGNATGIKTSNDPRFIVNLSVWETPEQFERFVWLTVHKRFQARRAEWFEPPKEAYFVIWWVPVGHRPTADEALDRLADLRANGPTARAFGWESLPDLQLLKDRRGG